MALNPMQQLENKFVAKKVEIGGHQLVIRGKHSTLLYLGITPDTETADSSLGAVDRAITRKAHKRARWYGDILGTTVKASVVNEVIYQQETGGAQPGRPIGFMAVSDTFTNGSGGQSKVTGTIELTGPFGWFVAYMEEHRPPKSVRFRSPRGHFLKQPTLSQTEFDAL